MVDLGMILAPKWAQNQLKIDEKSIFVRVWLLDMYFLVFFMFFSPGTSKIVLSLQRERDFQKLFFFGSGWFWDDCWSILGCFLSFFGVRKGSKGRLRK